MCSFAVVCGSISAFPANAGEPYESYNYDSWGEAIPSQAGYIPDRAVSGQELGAGGFDSPSDIFFAGYGIFYIVDTKTTV